MISGAAAGQTVSLPAPYGGWNTVDSLAAMPEQDAVILDNYYARGSDVVLRRGYAAHATGLGADVHSIFVYDGATPKMFAQAATNVYDVTSAGAVGAAVISGLANIQCETVNIATSGGQYLYLANGTDSPRLWDGAVWTTITGVSTPAITGVTTSTLKVPVLHKNRLWFLQSGTLVAWYLPVNSVGGAATAFDLRSVARKGGTLVACSTWTIDAGAGSDDHLVFVTSRGEVIVYRGTNPASDFNLLGIYEIGSPVGGARCLRRYAGDVFILTTDGLLPLSRLVQSASVDRTAFLSYKIQPTFNAATATFAANLGWQIFHFPSESLLMVNIPTSGTTTIQHVQSLITGAWARFTAVEALAFALFAESPFFGGRAGIVHKLWSVDDDAGMPIEGRIKPAFNFYGARAAQKRWTMARLFFSGTSAPAIAVKWNQDYKDEPPVSFSTPAVPSSFGVWDTSKWDQAQWAPDSQFFVREFGVTGVGSVGTPYVKTQTKGVRANFISYDVVFEVGGFT